MRGHKIEIINGEKLCASCNEIKPLAAYGNAKTTASGFTSYCKACLAERARQMRASPQGKARHAESNQRWVDSLEGQQRLAEGFKVCPKCKIEKPFSAYPRNKRTKHGIGSRCSICTVSEVQAYRATAEGAQNHREASKKWREANMERHKDNNAKRSYGLEHGQYDAMLATQDGKCAICKTAEPGTRLVRFHIDHSHSSSKIRGLLCEHCNRGLGHFKDDPALMRRAADYLASAESS